MFALDDIQLAIDKLQASLEQDFMTDVVREIIKTAIAHLLDAKNQLVGG